jgi:hypothetical protein
MKVLITGATGLVGSAIVKLCIQQGFSVNYLTRNSANLSNEENHKGFHWDIDKGEIDESCFEDVNAIIHLAGSSIAKRWTDAHKESIIDSRVKSAELLLSTLKRIPNQIEHFISASAIGVYPSSYVNYYTEEFNTISSSFLGQVVSQWEASADQFKKLNISVAKVRIGLVLDQNEGALPQMAKTVKLGVGSSLGNGEQWQSWIHIEDLAAVFLHVLNHNLEGVYNGVSPAPKTNELFTKELASSLGKPFFMPKVPAIMLKLFLGDMHMLLLESQRVSSKKIENSGFEFKYHCLKHALEAIYNVQPVNTNVSSFS